MEGKRKGQCGDDEWFWERIRSVEKQRGKGKAGGELKGARKFVTLKGGGEKMRKV